MLFVIYLLQTGQLRIESEIKYLRLYEFEKIVASDMEQIKRDNPGAKDRIMHAIVNGRFEDWPEAYRN